MHSGALLDLTQDLLREVLRFDAPADAVVVAFGRRHRRLGSRERHLLAETVFALLRRRLYYEHLAQGSDGSQERRLAILAWQGQGSDLAAALDPATAAWREQALAVDPATLPEATRHNLPDWLAAALRRQLDRETEFTALAQSLLEPAPLDLRVNLLRGKREAALQALAADGVVASPTPWSPWGLRVHGKPSLTKTRAFQRGDIEVQDEGSQLLALLLDARRGEMVVDFCAGTGGKTLALGASMRNTGRLYAFDTSGHRLDALKPRQARSGLTQVYPVQIAHERDDRIDRLVGKIDRVLVDAPCSGLGTLRRNPDLKWRQSARDLESLGQRQQAILGAAASLLKPGGRLVYATCSLLHAENEAVAEAFEQGQGRAFGRLDAAQALGAAHVPQAAALCDGPNLRLWPHRHGTDGFFGAAWTRLR